MYKFIGKKNEMYSIDINSIIKLNYKCKKEDSPDGSNKCSSENGIQKVDLNPTIQPGDYNSYEKNRQLILKDKSEPDRVMRRLNAETLERRFYRITKEKLQENKIAVDTQLMERGKTQWEKLSKESQDALKDYTASSYGVTNSALQEDITRDEVKYLKEATSQPLGFSTILYRGISFKLPNDVYKAGTKWTHKPFGSCSVGSFIAEEAASGKLTHVESENNTILEIFTDPETKGFAIGKNSFHAGADTGSEVILDSGTRFGTIHTEKSGNKRVVTVRVLHDKD